MRPEKGGTSRWRAIWSNAGYASMGDHRAMLVIEALLADAPEDAIPHPTAPADGHDERIGFQLLGPREQRRPPIRPASIRRTS